MRMPNEGEDLVGKICVCSIGRPAIVTGRDKLSDNTPCWVGLGIDGKGTWASRNPAILSESAKEHHDRLFSIAKRCSNDT
jgi:hypothetical protein